MYKNQRHNTLTITQKATLNTIKEHITNNNRLPSLRDIAKIRGVHYTTVRECVYYLITIGHIKKVCENGRSFFDLVIQEEQSDKETPIIQEETKSASTLAKIKKFLWG